MQRIYRTPPHLSDLNRRQINAEWEVQFNKIFQKQPKTLNQKSWDTFQLGVQETGMSSLQTKKKASRALSQGKNKTFVEYIPTA